MKRVLFCNRKGGTGKSTAAAEFVLSLQRTGIAYQFFDLDQQEGSILQEHEDSSAEIEVIDLPGALTKDLDNDIANASVCCVCTKASPLDMASLEVMIDKYRQHSRQDAKLIVIIGMFTRWSNGASFYEYVKDLIADIPGANVCTIMQSEMFPQAAAQGKSVVEYAPKTSAAKSVLDTVNVIRGAAGLPCEE